jgi:predicted anti-sigma-YlaC factor YlaD
MKHEDAKMLYQDWIEGRVDDATRLDIQEHLDDCNECRSYFEKMTQLLEKPDPAHLPRLEPDAFLPAKIRGSFGRRQKQATFGKTLGWIRLSLASAVFALAVTAGVFLGAGLSSAIYANEDTEIVEAYYEAFSQSGFAEDWENVFLEESVENNGTM